VLISFCCCAQATQFGLNGNYGLAWASSVAAGGFAFFVWRGFRRVRLVLPSPLADLVDIDPGSVKWCVVDG